MHDKDVLKYVRETHQKALAHNRELANPLTWANVRREWDEAAKEMDCFFEEVATLATSEAQYTGRSTARAPPDTLIKCAKVIMAKPALKRFVAPLLDAAGELSAADDEVRDAKIDAEATDVRDALVASSRARRRGVAVVKLALGMIPLMQLMRIGNQKQLRHFNIVYGEVSDAASSFTAPSWSPTRHRRDHVFVSTARRSGASPTIARLTIPCTQVMRSEYARDAFLDAHSAAGQNASHQQLNAFEAEYTKAVARNLAATLEARPDQQLVIIADNVVLTVNHQDQRAERASSSQIDATVVVALLVPRDHGLGDDKPQYVCVTQDVEAFGYSFAEIASGARSAQGEVYLPTIDGTPRAIGDCFIATLEDGHRLEFVKIKSAADVMRECPGWGGFEPVLPYTRSAGHLFEYQLHDSPRPHTGTVYGDASNERPTMQELYDDCLRREAYEMLYEAVERYDVARPAASRPQTRVPAIGAHGAAAQRVVVRGGDLHDAADVAVQGAGQAPASFTAARARQVPHRSRHRYGVARPVGSGRRAGGGLRGAVLRAVSRGAPVGRRARRRRALGPTRRERLRRGQRHGGRPAIDGTIGARSPCPGGI